MNIRYLINGLFGSNCRFKRRCQQYNASSATCNNGGGIYCGKYREIKKLEASRAKKEI